MDEPSGAGKSTVVEHLAQLLVAGGEEVHLTAEPSSGPIGGLCRELTETVTGHALARLYAADRYHHPQTEIRPATQAGRNLISDRFIPSALVLPCTEDPELFFAESPHDVEQAKAMCRAWLACLAPLERREPWGVWGGELLMSGAIVPHKRSRGRPRKDVVTIGANAWAAAVDLAQPG